MNENVVDNGDNTLDFRQCSGNYIYDANGNMIVDPNKGLSDVKYNKYDYKNNPNVERNYSNTEALLVSIPKFIEPISTTKVNIKPKLPLIDETKHKKEFSHTRE